MHTTALMTGSGQLPSIWVDVGVAAFYSLWVILGSWLVIRMVDKANGR